MTLAILGAGAIGQLLAHQLAAAGEAPWLLQRASPATAPFVLETTQGCQQHEFQQLSVTASAATLAPIRLLIVTLKAYQVLPAVTPLLTKLAPECHLLLLHNGIGPHLSLLPLLAGRGLSLGTTSQGAIRMSAQHVRHTGTGLTQFGPMASPPMADRLKQTLLRAIPNSQWCDPILPALWGKLAVNAAINPLTALADVPNGALAATDYQQQIAQIVDELLAVAAKENVPLQRTDLLQRIAQVIQLTAANSSSMRQDLQHHRPTEIDAINGFIVACAKRHGLTAPLNQQLLDAINARGLTNTL